MFLNLGLLHTYLRLQLGVLGLKFLYFGFVILGAADAFLEVGHRVAGLVGLLVKGHQGLGQDLQHAGLLQVLLEFLLLSVLRHLVSRHGSLSCSETEWMRNGCNDPERNNSR